MEEHSININTILNSIEALNELINVPLPAVTSFNIRKVATALEAERLAATEAITARREELYVDDKTPSEKEIKALNEEVEQLLEREITLKFDKINISDLGTVSIKPRTLMALDWLIVG